MAFLFLLCIPAAVLPFVALSRARASRRAVAELVEREAVLQARWQEIDRRARALREGTPWKR